MSTYLVLFKIQSLLFILMKVALLLKYFFFVKHRGSDWKAYHMIYFPTQQIQLSRTVTCAKAKKLQNILSTCLLQMFVMALLIRLTVSITM